MEVSMETNNNWMLDETIKDISQDKIMFLQNMLFESKKHTGKEMLPFFMSIAMKAKSQNISFSQEEINTIIPVLKKYASEDEIAKMNQMIKMFYNRK